MPARSDLREAWRKRVLLSGKIAYGDGAFSCGCSIRDLSASGARIGISGATVLPKYFYLIDLRQATAYECEVIWRNATQTGVRFRDAVALSDILDQNLAFLKRLYVEACLR
ncbi:MAG: PilZ domain-containing protein [Rhizomicrobium sp.]